MHARAARHARRLRHALLAGLLLGVRPAGAHPPAQPRGEAWGTFRIGERVELDVACSGHWEPVTLLKSEAVAGRSDRDYTVRRQNGSEWSFRAPGIVAPCGRAAGGLARERAALPAPPVGVYGCTYRGQPVPAMDFALLGASTYRDRDGGRGSYRSDPRTRELAFLTGPMRGMRAQQLSAGAVQMLREDGTPSGNVCAHNAARSAGARRL